MSEEFLSSGQDWRGRFQASALACINNGKRLLDDAEWTLNRETTGIALAMLAQEEFAKAFVLSLVGDGHMPWTSEVRTSLSRHECKQLVMVCMEWLSEVAARRDVEFINPQARTDAGKTTPSHLPAEVAKAVNIYRHESIERIGNRHPDRYSEWNGESRKVARGLRDRKKQNALYVDIRADGAIGSVPTGSTEELERELSVAKEVMGIANDVAHGYTFAIDEFALLSSIFETVFADMHPQFDRTSIEQVFDDVIPGIRFVRTQITIADVVEDGDLKTDPL